TNLADGGYLSGTTNADFLIAWVLSGDAGNYDVIVTNAYGSVTSAVVTLTVLSSNTATVLVSLTNCLGTSASFTTVAGGTGPFTYQWTKNGTNFAGATQSVYSIGSVVAADAGGYCVQVSSACGSVTNCAMLTVTTPTFVETGFDPNLDSLIRAT